jgi:hypothetical protein
MDVMGREDRVLIFFYMVHIIFYFFEDASNMNLTLQKDYIITETVDQKPKVHTCLQYKGENLLKSDTSCLSHSKMHLYPFIEKG